MIERIDSIELREFKKIMIVVKQTESVVKNLMRSADKIVNKPQTDLSAKKE